MNLKIDLNVYIGDKEVDKIYLGDQLVYSAFTDPVYNTFTGEETRPNEITLTYDIDNKGETIDSIEWSKDNGGTWTSIGNSPLSGTIVVDSLESGNVYLFTLRVKSGTEIVESNSISVSLSGDTIVWYEDGETAQRVPGTEDWLDTVTPEENTAIAGGNVRVRDTDPNADGRYIQINHLAWNQATGVFDGTRRLTHPFKYFYLDPARAYELSIDWYFETVWDFNTIGRDRTEMIQRVVDHGYGTEVDENGDTVVKQYTQAEAEILVDDILTKDDGTLEATGPSNPYYETGFPYQVGKMHGLTSFIPSGGGATGSIPPDVDEWTVRISWVKNTKSHPAKGDIVIDGVTFPNEFVDGHNPNSPPKLAMYFYDQDGIQRYSYMNEAPFLEQNKWYRVKLFVQVNDQGKNNGIAELKVYDRATNTLLGSCREDNLKLHDVDLSTNPDALVNILSFNTSFGGGDFRFSPKINPSWKDESFVITNNGVYCRNDNYKATRLGTLEPPVIESESYTGNDLELTVGYGSNFSLVDDVEVNITPVGGTYDSDNWSSVIYTVTNEKATFTIADVSSDETIHVRIDRGGRKSARSDGWIVDIPSIPNEPAILSIEGLDLELDVEFAPPSDDGNSPITTYEYRIDGGIPIDLNYSGNDFAIASFSVTQLQNGDPLVQGETYQIEIRAVNAIGNSDWSVPVNAGLTDKTVLFNGESGIWTFENNYNNVYADQAGKEAGILTYVSGVDGKAVSFNGSSFIDTQREDVGNGLHAVLGKPFFVMVNFRVDPGDFGTIVSRCQKTPGKRTFQLFAGTDSNLAIVLNSDTSHIIHENIDDGQWHHVTVRWDGTAATAFMDGVSVGVIPVGDGTEDVGKHLMFGTRDQDEPGFNLTGQIDTVIIGDFEITDQQVSDIVDDPNNLNISPYIKTFNVSGQDTQISTNWEIA